MRNMLSPMNQFSFPISEPIPYGLKGMNVHERRR